MDWQSTTDRQLVSEALRQNRDAFDEIARRHFGAVYAVGLARLGDREKAEDLAQEVFLRAFLLIERLNDPDLLSHWLVRIARNLAVDWQRSGARSARITSMLPLSELPDEAIDQTAVDARELAASSERLNALQQVLKGMAAEQRELVLLHYMEGLSHGDIAARLGMNRSTVSRQIARTVQSMRGMLESMLREMATGLRARPSATARTVATGAALLTLSSATRGVMANTAAQLTPAGSHVPANSWIKALLSAGKTGGTLVGYGKTVGAVVAVALVGAGSYKYMEHPDNGPAITRPSAGGQALAGGELASFRFALPAGKRVVMRTEMRTKVSTTGMPNAAGDAGNSDINQIRDIAVICKEQRPDGSSAVEFEIVGTQIELSGRGKHDLYGAGTLAVPPTGTLDPMLAPLMGSFLGKPVTAEVSASGELTIKSGLKELTAGVKNNLNAAAQAGAMNMVSADTLAETFRSLIAPKARPTGSVKVGDTWSGGKSIATVGALKDLMLDQTYKFNGWKEVDGKRVAEIQNDATLQKKSDATFPGSPKMSFSSMRSSGTIYFEPELGMVNQALMNTTMEMNMKLPMGGATADVTMHTETTQKVAMLKETTGEAAANAANSAQPVVASAR